MSATLWSWFGLAACTATPERPATTDECESPQTFYVVTYGRHSALVIDRADLTEREESLAEDFDAGEFLEIGWGDAKYYQAADAGVGAALRAILWPTETVLHVVGIPTSPSRYFVSGDLYAVSVPEIGYRDLLEFVAASFARSEDGGLVRLGPALYGAGWFYQAEGKFHAANTCNTWIAQALAATGYPHANVDTVFAGGVASQLQRGFEANHCYTVQPVSN